jgi:hypothetical protein
VSKREEQFIEIGRSFPALTEVLSRPEGRMAFVCAINAVFASRPAADESAKPFQARVQPWMMACFGAEIAGDRMERNHRFFEEATETVQANGMTRSEAHQLVDYTFDRPIGELHQEIGGVMVTLAALCLASGEDMHAAGETELARIWTKVEKIRAKQAAKPKHSPLPEHTEPATPDSKEAVTLSDEEFSSLPFLSEQDSAALFVFNSQCEDSDADGYAVRAEMMDRLAELGVVQRLTGRGRKFGVTSFGSWLIETEFAQEPMLPLRTIAEHNVREKAGHTLYLKESAPNSTAWVELSRNERESWRRKADTQRDASKAEPKS